MTPLLRVLLPVWLAAPPPGVATRVLPEGPESGAVLVATERGLYRNAGQGWDLVLARGAVHDLVGLPGGWLAAAADGLYEAVGDGVRAHLLGAGARARSLAVAADGGVWAATDAGLYARAAGERDFTLDVRLPAGPIRAVRAVGERVWIARNGELWTRDADGAWRARVRGLGPGWWELVGAAATRFGVLLAVPRGLWRVEGDEVRRIEHAGGDLHALAIADGTVWLASARGLLRTSLDRLGSGVPELVLEGEAFDAVQDAGGLLVMTRSGVARLPLQSARRPLAYRRPRVDPSAVQRAVIAYQGLSPSRMRRLAARARQTAWWPQMRLNASWDLDRARDTDRDQTFSSGAVRQLRDSARERDTNFGLDLQLTWNLARLAEPDDLLAISRESRELVELRDQVLERVNRLYFERRRVLEERAAAAPEEQRALALRAEELSAQLDGWTGGLFSRLETSADSPQNEGNQP